MAEQRASSAVGAPLGGGFEETTHRNAGIGERRGDIGGIAIEPAALPQSHAWQTRTSACRPQSFHTGISVHANRSRAPQLAHSLRAYRFEGVRNQEAKGRITRWAASRMRRPEGRGIGC